MADVRIVWDRAALRGLKTDPQVVAHIERAAEDMAQELAAAAPRDSGQAAATIEARDSRAAGAQDVGWDADHFYLIFPEYGTDRQPAQRFARDLLNSYVFI
jgi:HK97 gp10 family phage protein